jgi:alkylation response protein AidB-like acyl-CoA dehydrogenase
MMQRNQEVGGEARADRISAPVFQGPAALLDAIRQIMPEIAERAGEMERARALPRDLFEKIAATGVFRMVLARDFGGAEYRLPDVIPIIEEIARADGSTAWNVFIGAELASIWQHFDRDVVAAVFAAERNVMTRAPLSPRGTAENVDGGFLLNGHWPLASGSYENEWVLVCAAIVEGGAPVIDDLGMPDLRIFALPAPDVSVVETWDSIGLRSTMSNDVVVDGKYVPAEHCIPFSKVESDGPLIGRLPLWLALGPFHCAMVLGVARGMLDELATLACTKRPILNPAIRMSEDPLIQYRIGALEVRFAAARSFLISETEAAWTIVAGGTAVPPMVRARSRSMMAFVHGECMAIANEVFSLAGSNVLYNDSALQRRFRDMRAACQHIVASTEIFRPLGALVLGEATPTTMASL